ncbi:MAG TPA: glycosyltransferase family 4 protein [Flavitalea sp.]|nr:glycosyltransferase family 4 protein [Flavitalea sp.]
MHLQNRIFFTVTNELCYDQRMIRICTALAGAGSQVTLVGRKLRGAPSLADQPFRQKRLFCFFTKGAAFYAEFNIRLFFYLLFRRMDMICAIDLDTILPCYAISVIKKIPRIYDAHELFCEMKEIVTRPRIYAIWKRIERFSVPRFKQGYTVNAPIAAAFKEMYGVDYAVIRNIPLLKPLDIPPKPEKYILYQGAVNEGRSFETLIPAMQRVDARLVVCGDGNFKSQAEQLTKQYGLEKKVIFTGKLLPEALRAYTINAWAGVTLFDDRGLSNYYSLANRFFDYLHAGIPQLCVDYPAYREINNICPFAVLIDDLSPDAIARALNKLLYDDQLYADLQQNCLKVRLRLNWQEEEKELIAFYQNLINPVG